MAQFVGGSKSLAFVTTEGTVLVCGDYQNRQGTSSIKADKGAIPRLIGGFSGVKITHVAMHSGGRHALAITSTGALYSWGDGEDGKLGHGNTTLVQGIAAQMHAFYCCSDA